MGSRPILTRWLAGTTLREIQRQAETSSKAPGGWSVRHDTVGTSSRRPAVQQQWFAPRAWQRTGMPLKPLGPGGASARDPPTGFPKEEGYTEEGEKTRARRRSQRPLLRPPPRSGATDGAIHRGASPKGARPQARPGAHKAQDKGEALKRAPGAFLPAKTRSMAAIDRIYLSVNPSLYRLYKGRLGSSQIPSILR